MSSRQTLVLVLVLEDPEAATMTGRIPNCLRRMCHSETKNADAMMATTNSRVGTRHSGLRRSTMTVVVTVRRWSCDSRVRTRHSGLRRSTMTVVVTGRRWSCDSRVRTRHSGLRRSTMTVVVTGRRWSCDSRVRTRHSGLRRTTTAVAVTAVTGRQWS